MTATRTHFRGRAPRVISLFSGAGGLDLGFEAAGFETVVSVEIDPEAVSTLRHNRGWPIIDRDIHTVEAKELLRKGSLAEGDADVLIGGPPCQPFSKSGYWASGDTLRLEDSRAGTLGAFLRILRDTLPRSFLLENVPGLAYQQKREGIDLIYNTIAQINRERGTSYRIAKAKLNAAHFGVPQLRERVFLVGERTGLNFSFPAPTHGESLEACLPLGAKPFATAWDAIGDLEEGSSPELEARGKWADLLPSIPEGENYLWHTERGGGLRLFGWRRRYWSFLLKLAKRLPSWTIQAQPGPAIGPFHWRNRRLSARELCRIQTFPDSFSVLGNLASVQRQVGNAVPAALAEVIARAMRKQLLGHAIELTASLVPRPRLPLPQAEGPQEVPRQYQSLVGKHTAHPGTGKGYSATRRDEDLQAGNLLEAL